MSRTAPLTAAYDALISRGRLQPNKDQLALVKQLSFLQDRLTTANQSWNCDDSRSINSSSSSSNSHVQHRNGIYIYGGVGTGKSRIADLFASTLPDKISRRRAHFFEFMTDMHMRLHRARFEPNYAGDPLIRIGQEIQHESSVLCLDEFQVSDIADAMILKRLFGSFWDSGGIMVSTSNRHPNDLYKDGLNRPLFVPFIEELQRRCVVFRMPGDHDYRMDGHEKQQKQLRQDTFFTERSKFLESLDSSLQGAELQPYEVKVVMNRKFQVQAANAEQKAKLIVSTNFTELCEASLGAADYHALCKAARTIYISGLRRFAADELDIVRRFIVLIDVAYESRTRIISLSTEPLLETFKNIVDPETLPIQTSSTNTPWSDGLNGGDDGVNLRIRGEGGSSSSMMSTFIGQMEWSATGLQKASLATGGAGEKEVRFAITRAISRLHEMSSTSYGEDD